MRIGVPEKSALFLSMFSIRLSSEKWRRSWRLPTRVKVGGAIPVWAT